MIGWGIKAARVSRRRTWFEMLGFGISRSQDGWIGFRLSFAILSPLACLEFYYDYYYNYYYLGLVYNYSNHDQNYAMNHSMLRLPCSIKRIRPY